MNSSIWASLDDFLPPGTGVSRLGRNMANHFFLRALFRYGTFDEYHFFLSNSAHKKLFLDAQGPLLDALGVRDRVRLFERLDLPEKLADTDYRVFHQSDHINYFSALCRLRDRVGAATPVTAFIHSISYQEYMPKYLEMCTAGPGASDALICSSKCGKEALENVFGRLAEAFPHAAARMQMPVVPLGIDEHGALPDKGAARASSDIGDEEIVALSFGRFSELDKMDLFPLLQAFAQVANGDRRFRLVLAGAVHSQRYLEMLVPWIDALKIRDSVRIVPDPSEAQKADLFAAADFFVSLADNPQETFGLTVLEAMRAGLPAVVSDFNGYRETVTDDVGFRIPTLWGRMPELDALQPLMDERTFHLIAAQSIRVDVGYAAAAMHLLFTDEGLRQRMGAAASMRFSACYTHAGIVRKLEAFWDSLKAGAAPSATGPSDAMSLAAFETFAHYTTGSLCDETRLAVTPFGMEILAQRSTHPLLPNMAKLVDNRLVIALMQRVGGGATVKTILSDLPGPDYRLRYTLLWMLKHDLLAELEAVPS